MENFEPIFYKEVRDHLVSLPMNMDGVKELYENMRRVSYNTYVKLNEIYNTGMSVLEMRKKTNGDRLLPINKILSNIEQLLITTDLKIYDIYYETKSCQYL
jgi:hypothetical protein